MSQADTYFNLHHLSYIVYYYHKVKSMVIALDTVKALDRIEQKFMLNW